MFRMRSTLKFSLASSLVAGGLTAGLVVTVGSSPAVAASKTVTCPDNTTGVIDGSWNVVCTGQTAADASVNITEATSKALIIRVEPKAANDTIGTVDASYDATETACILMVGQDGTTSTVNITEHNTTAAITRGIVVMSSSWGECESQSGA